jgi:hypothetical protein
MKGDFASLKANVPPLPLNGDALARDVKKGEVMHKIYKMVNIVYVYLLLSHFPCLYNIGLIMAFNLYLHLVK